MSNIHVEHNFYVASHLLAEGFVFDHLDESKPKHLQYHFNNNELLQKAIAEFNGNTELRSFISGMKEIKKHIKRYNHVKKKPINASMETEAVIDEIV